MRLTNKNISRKAAAITLASALTIFGGAGAALAYWTTTGSGSGSAAVQAAAGTVTLSAGAISGLAPGSGAVTKDVNATNAGNTDLFVGDVTVTMSAGTLDDAELRRLGVSASVAQNDDLAAHGATTKVGAVTVEIENLATVNQDALKGATIDLHFTSN